MRTVCQNCSNLPLAQSSPNGSQTRQEWSAVVVFGLLSAVLCMCAGYFKLFTTWAPYDDEGYVLVTLQHYAQGWKLYDDIFTQYGPAFYQLESLIGKVLPHDLTSDNQRLKTLVLWSLSAAMGGWAMARLVASHWIGIVGAIVLFLHLDRLALEPGHPQMWCALFTSFLFWWLASPSSSRHSFAYWLTAGMLCGLLMMIKPNIGVFAFGGIFSAMVWRGLDRSRPLGFTLEFIFICLVVAAPWLLFRSVLGNAESWIVPLVTGISMLLMRRECILRSDNSVESPSDTPIHAFCVFRDLGYLTRMLGLSVGTVAIVLFSLAIELRHGVSMASLKRGMVGQHGDLIAQFYHAAPIPRIAWIASMAVVLTWGLAILSNKLRTPLAKCEPLMDFVCVIVAGVSLWLLMQDMGTPLRHGLEPRGGAGLLAGVGCLISSRWIRKGHTKPDGCIDRAPMVGVALLAPLASFPVPGTQLAVGTIGLCIVVGSLVAPIVGLQIQKLGLPRVRSTRWLFAGGVAVVMLAILPNSHRWSQRQSLGLKGATLLRLSEEETECYRRVIESIQLRGANSIVFMWHNRNSFYGWSGLPPASPQSPTFWPYLLSGEQQERVDRDLQRFERVAVVDEAYQPSFLPPITRLQSEYRDGAEDRREVAQYVVSIKHIHSNDEHGR